MTRIGTLSSRVTAPSLAVALVVLLAGCKVFETNAPSPEFSVPEAFDEAPACGVCLSSQDLADWWTVWRDPTLDRLIKNALEANTDLRIAQARVAEARSLAAIVESALYPTVGAQGGQWGGAMQWNNPLVNAIPGGSHTFDAHLVGAAAGWEPDIFEGHADDAEAARAAALSVEEQLNGARMIVVAEVAENYQEARGLQRRLAVLDASIATLEQMLRYVEARYAAGQALAYDVTEVRERLESQRGKRPVLVSLLDVRQRRLAVLTGRVPEKIERLSPPGTFAAPAVPRGQLPSDVLERRPDVRARALLVRAQVAKLSSAKTDLLPRFQISFFGGDGRLHFEGLPGLQGTGGLVGLTAQLPIFTAGRIEANIAANDARLEQAAADHDKSVLRALEEVEGAYGRRFGFDKRAADIRQALENAKRNEKASIGLYEGGRKTFGDAVNAKLDAFERSDELVQTQMEQAAATVQLYLALGGGW
ncbi:MAG: TolC family protein [Roseiarcus sp.]|jgi:NodT family efflux transporter outer membrane factor (OMF) lipoprotein